VNGESVLDKTYSYVVQQIKRSGETLKLLVVPQEDDLLQMVIFSLQLLSSVNNTGMFSDGFESILSLYLEFLKVLNTLRIVTKEETCLLS